MSLSELIASLPEEERVILTLHYLQARSATEIGALLEVPEKAVISVIGAAKSRLIAAITPSESR